MRTRNVLAVVIAVVLAASALAAAKKSESHAAMLKEAKVTEPNARKVALERAPGNVESSELEREHGHLIWSFDIRNAKGTIDEVAVDAVNGKILTVEHETAKQEAAEKKQEAKEKTAASKH
jgi:uncharacterized membrane protein YkoI